jgi:hypothetical protein
VVKPHVHAVLPGVGTGGPFNLGAQCRRAGMTFGRTLDFYRSESHDVKYCAECIGNGWKWQEAEYRKRVEKA